MNYDSLTQKYWSDQIVRVNTLSEKIYSRPPIGSGKTVPEDDSLSIGTGKCLSMAVMFIDICDFSSRPMVTIEEQDRTLRILNLYFTEMIRIAEEYNGNIEKNTGDGLLVYFNDNEGNPPTSGSMRAIACALTMFAATEALINPIILNLSERPIQFRVSIDYGQVTIARIGAPKRFNANVAIGTTANFASKMLRYAHPNSIVIGESAINKIPLFIRYAWTRLLSINTGWVYIQSQKPYPLYECIKRWSIPS